MVPSYSSFPYDALPGTQELIWYGWWPVYFIRIFKYFQFFVIPQWHWNWTLLQKCVMIEFIPYIGVITIRILDAIRKNIWVCSNNVYIVAHGIQNAIYVVFGYEVLNEKRFLLLRMHLLYSSIAQTDVQ